jgi:methyl coenzyme M reductase subunit D
MEVSSNSTLHHVVINIKERKIEMHGDDGEVKIESCTWDKEGCEQFENMVKFCQDILPPEMRTYEL